MWSENRWTESIIDIYNSKHKKVLKYRRKNIIVIGTFTQIKPLT